MPNMPTPETITDQHPNHISIQESVSCEKCNPFALTEKQYRAILDQGGDPSQEQEQVS